MVFLESHAHFRTKPPKSTSETRRLNRSSCAQQRLKKLVRSTEPSPPPRGGSLLSHRQGAGVGGGYEEATTFNLTSFSAEGFYTLVRSGRRMFGEAVYMRVTLLRYAFLWDSTHMTHRGETQTTTKKTTSDEHPAEETPPKRRSDPESVTCPHQTGCGWDHSAWIIHPGSLQNGQLVSELLCLREERTGSKQNAPTIIYRNPRTASPRCFY